MSAIEHVHARQILDSRGNPTVEVDVRLQSGAHGRAAVPSGASTGTREALELRDGGDAFGGKAVTHAVEHGNGEIAQTVRGRDAGDQRGLDDAMIALDRTPGKSRLGANAILGVSMATARAAADDQGEPLWRYLGGPDTNLIPVPCMNVLNGGVHADNPVDFQEFMIAPIGAKSIAQAIQIGSEVYHELQRTLKSRGLATSVGDEGGFAPALESNQAPTELLMSAIQSAGYTPGEQVALCLDPAASEFFKNGSYEHAGEGRTLTSDEMVDYLATIPSRFPVLFLEDGMAESDWDGWSKLTDRIGKQVQLARRRHLRHQSSDPARGDRTRHCKLDPDQAQPDRNGHRDTRHNQDRARSRLPRSRLTPLRGNRGHLHRRLCRRDRGRSDQDRRARPRRARHEVQPANTHRGTVGRRGSLRRRLHGTTRLRLNVSQDSRQAHHHFPGV